MISFFILSLLTLLTGLISPNTFGALAAPTAPSYHLSNRDPTTIRRSSAQIGAFLQGHNTVRAKHNAKPLTWSVPLAEKAEQWADACNFRHTNGVLSDTPYGENIVAATGDFPISAAMATFVQDADQFNPLNPTYTHFAQVIWKSTTEVGCAVSRCDGIFDKSLGPATLYVCLYNPAGNVVGELLQNVQL
ncbi:PR-1-like protein [Macrolepiota fuliginosa MF-IS2]|uniref:PR-1-like protein n=1 Tax=Macrolepiota fuliginosa MF-IS2 TaxID=1400762 RepID=A0A9P5XFD3_9AGAR|nr:PR-1-like protein [Macrolepiota fuliginosa MF-IS2]